MKLHKYPGIFVDIEGLDGSGSHTQAKLVTRVLEKEGLKPFLTKEPSAGPAGDLLRRILTGKDSSFPPSSVQLLFAADRGWHLEKEIIPRLEKGEVVVTDRYLWSSVAFGSVELSRQWLLDLNSDFILPDLTVFLEVSPETCLARLAREKTGVELLEKEEELARAWANYHALASKYWWANLQIVDGERDKKTVTEAVWRQVSRLPKIKKIVKP